MVGARVAGTPGTGTAAGTGPAAGTPGTAAGAGTAAVFFLDGKGFCLLPAV